MAEGNIPPEQGPKNVPAPKVPKIEKPGITSSISFKDFSPTGPTQWSADKNWLGIENPGIKGSWKPGDAVAAEAGKLTDSLNQSFSSFLERKGKSMNNLTFDEAKSLMQEFQGSSDVKEFEKKYGVKVTSPLLEETSKKHS